MPTQKLELTWVGKDQQVKIEPRILLEDPEKGYGDRDTGNLLIHGDNLLALKALEAEYTGRVKCIYIDPPYNTGSAFEHYDDNLEHSTWLSLMRPRLKIIKNLLSDQGSLWVSIDDYEMPYLRVLLDEVFGRNCFVASNVWQKRYSRENREAIGDVHEYVVVYAKSPEQFKEYRNKIPISPEQTKIYKNLNKDPKGPWRPIPMTAQGYRPNQMYPITTPTGVVHYPPEGRCWSTIEQEYLKLKEQGLIYFGKDGSSQPNIIRYLSQVEGFIPWTWWPSNEVGHTDEAKKEMQVLFGKDNVFQTPKPERLLERIITIASNPGDLVLDSFLGSGTTAAVAHKMGRRWIGIELGDHCYTHCLPRLKAVVDGEQGGISESVGWKGGGGFRFCELAPSLLRKDKYGQWVIDERYNADMLAAAMAKHEGFRYSPDPEVYWKQGYSSEKSFIFTTTAHITAEYVDALQQELKSGETLLICASTYEPAATRFPNIVVKKIPQILFGRCEFGAQGYGLNIVTPLDAEEDEEE